MRALPFAARRKPLSHDSMLVESSTSAATKVHERQALRAARKYFAASD